MRPQRPRDAVGGDPCEVQCFQRGPLSQAPFNHGLASPTRMRGRPFNMTIGGVLPSLRHRFMVPADRPASAPSCASSSNASSLSRSKIVRISSRSLGRVARFGESGSRSPRARETASSTGAGLLWSRLSMFASRGARRVSLSDAMEETARQRPNARLPGHRTGIALASCFILNDQCACVYSNTQRGTKAITRLFSWSRQMK